MVADLYISSIHRDAFLEDFNQGYAAVEALSSKLYSADEILDELRVAMDPYLASFWRISLLLREFEPRTHFHRQQVLDLLQELAAHFEAELHSCHRAQEHVSTIEERIL